MPVTATASWGENRRRRRGQRGGACSERSSRSARRRWWSCRPGQPGTRRPLILAPIGDIPVRVVQTEPLGRLAAGRMGRVRAVPAVPADWLPPRGWPCRARPRRRASSDERSPSRAPPDASPDRCARHRTPCANDRQICSVTPILRQTCIIARPLDSSTSAWHSFRMISSGLCFFPGIVLPLLRGPDSIEEPGLGRWGAGR